MTQCSHRRRIARILGNFGVSFLSPLASINIGTALLHNTTGIPFSETVLISLISAMIITGLSISREAIDYGSNKV